MTNPIIAPSARFCRASLTPSLLDNDFSPHPTGSTIEPPQRTVQLVTPSGALRELLTRCLLNAECRTLNAEEEETETRQADAGAGTTTPTSEDPIQRSAFSVQPSSVPDLVLLDLAAPDALTHCRALREQHPDLPIVALTPLVTDHLSAWEAGANAVLPIPFDVLDLRDLIRVLVEDRITGLGSAENNPVNPVNPV